MVAPSGSDTLPLVSVAITTFNSAKWLPRSIDSVLMQRTDFPIEIVIGDDCSKDETLSVARSYAERHPKVFKILERKSNIGIQHNYFETFEACTGQYTAWLDADDFWTDPDKLSIQAAALEADSGINVCAHYIRRVTNDGEVKRERYPSVAPGRYGLKDILRQNFVPSPSIMFRNGIQRSLPAWYFDVPYLTDWPLLVVAALSGDILLVDRVMADYTLTEGSAFESKGLLNWHEMDAKFYEHVGSILTPEWQRLVGVEKGKRYESIAYRLREQGRFSESRAAAVKAFFSPAWKDNVGSKTKALIAATVRNVEWKLRSSLRVE